MIPQLQVSLGDVGSIALVPLPPIGYGCKKEEGVLSLAMENCKRLSGSVCSGLAQSLNCDQ